MAAASPVGDSSGDKWTVPGSTWTVTDGGQQRHAIAGPLRTQANNMEMLLAAALAGLGIAYGPPRPCRRRAGRHCALGSPLGARLRAARQ